MTITLAATDPDGAADLATTFYTVDGGATQTYSSPFTVPGDAQHMLTFWSKDKAGNEETPHPSITVKIDGTKPTLTFGTLKPAPNPGGWNNTAVEIPFTATDNLSGVGSTSVASPLKFTTEGKGLTKSVTVTDVAGNSKTFTSPKVNLDKTAPVPRVDLPAAKTYFNTNGGIPVSVSGTDNLDTTPRKELFFYGQPFTQSIIAIAGLPFGEHVFQARYTDIAGNSAVKEVRFQVQPEPLAAFAVKKLDLKWKAGNKPKADTLKVEGTLDLPAAYTPAKLTGEAIVLVEIGGRQGTDQVLGRIKNAGWDYKRKKLDLPAGMNMDLKKLQIKWAKDPSKPNRFKLDASLAPNVFNDGSGKVALTLLLPVKAGGDLAGSTMVTAKIVGNKWQYP